MTKLLLDNPLLLLFIVAAIGYPLGRVKIKGSSIGVAAVLFAGLAVGSLDKDLKLPEVLYQFGLVLFVYTIGLSSGPSFFASFRHKGLRDNLLVAGMLLLSTVMTVILYLVFHLKGTLAAGMFTGSLTNTPALAGLLEYLKNSHATEQMLAEPVVGYSIAYPMGVVGMILAIGLAQYLWKIDYASESKSLREVGSTSKTLKNLTIHITNQKATQACISDLIRQNHWDVNFGRFKHEGNLSLIDKKGYLSIGDLVSIVGPAEELDRVAAYLGETTSEQLELDRSEFDFRRMFVSNPKVAGHRLRDLNLPQQFGAVVTRLRRGDVELVPHGDTALELGDRVRVVAKRESMASISAFFGDSYKALSEVDILTFSLGLTLGFLLGMVPIPLPGGVVFKLGLAGGPLIVALILSWLERTGPMVWALPYSANLTLRQLGLILFLAGVGTRSGYPFVNTFTQGGGVAIFFSGIVITCTTALLMLYVGYKILKIPMGLLTGMLAGLQTQPAVLGFALEQAENDLPNIGYATVYPVATIMKILLAQFLLSTLQ